MNGLRGLGGIWSHLHLVATAGKIGVRESRRVHGCYTVTAQDLAVGARHPDAVCRVTFGVDVHSTDQKDGTAIEAQVFQTQPYDIPLRALVARDVDGLMLAGRCISGDFLAHASYRVTGNAVPMGEAAGAGGAGCADEPPAAQGGVGRSPEGGKPGGCKYLTTTGALSRFLSFQLQWMV